MKNKTMVEALGIERERAEDLQAYLQVLSMKINSNSKILLKINEMEEATEKEKLFLACLFGFSISKSINQINKN